MHISSKPLYSYLIMLILLIYKFPTISFTYLIDLLIPYNVL